MFFVIYKNKRLIWELAKQKLHGQYASTLFGSVWSILQPVLTICVFWFVFSYGLKPQVDTSNIPYFLILFCGLIPWLTFHDALYNGTNVIVSYSYLVKKLVFPLEILPISSILSSFIIHGYLLIFLIFVLFSHSIFPNFYFLQVFYYIFAMVTLTTALCWVTSALNVFYKDIGQSLGPLLTLWFWITPIVWPIENLTSSIKLLIKLNPFYYIIEGYRNSLLYSTPIWQDWEYGLYFWTMTLSLFFGSFLFFNRVKDQFSDVI